MQKLSYCSCTDDKHDPATNKNNSQGENRLQREDMNLLTDRMQATNKKATAPVDGNGITEIDLMPVDPDILPGLKVGFHCNVGPGYVVDSSQY